MKLLRTSGRRAFALCTLASVSLLALPPVGAASPVAEATQLRTKKTLKGVRITEYFPVPEAWFVGAKVRAPGLSTRHRVDWLFSGRGVVMEGSGIDLKGNPVQMVSGFEVGWLSGQNTSYLWRAEGYWRNRSGNLTFRYQAPRNGRWWSNGTGRRWVAPRRVRFGRGAPRGASGRVLTYWGSVAVDPSLIPYGSLVYIGALKKKNGSGWFCADDTGGAIRGRHIDVFRPPPANRVGYSRNRATITVIPKRLVKRYTGGRSC